jgi:hypothetical protein
MGMNKKFLAAASLGLCAACGGGDQTYNLSGTATVTGTVAGHSLAAADAISTVASQSGASAGVILIGTQANQCNEINAHHDLKSATALTIALANRTGTSVLAPAIGTYSIFSQQTVTQHTGNVGDALFSMISAACLATTSVDVTSGTLTLTRVEATGYGGTFDLLFGTDHVTGSFNTGTCSALAAPQVSCPP